MSLARPKLFTIPAGVPFARALCAGVIERAGDGPFALADTLILVPTRRATNALRDAFAEALDRPSLLPRIIALGDVDEELDPADLDPDLDALAAISPLRRRLLLATLVQQWGAARGSPIALHHALNSAGELGSFLDETITHGIDLARLTDLVTGEMAAHWQEVLSFLNIVAVQWPKLLEAENATEAAMRRDANLRALARKLEGAQPKTPVIAAGSTGSIPATAELLKTVAHLPGGSVVLPGLDTSLDAQAWDQLEPTHPQFGIARLLVRIGASRDDVLLWSPLPDATANQAQRVRFLGEALRPAPATDAWREFVANWPAADAKAVLQNFAIVEAKTPREEALVIACAMREALETQGRTAALVTPDRTLARAVAAELARWNIDVDDSAGVPLTSTPPGMFLSLLATAAAEEMAPVPLLSLLKHPLASGGEDPAEFRRKARELEMTALRGLRPDAGLEGIAQRLKTKKAPHELRRWFDRLSRKLAHFTAALRQPQGDLAEIAALHSASAEDLAATGSSPGAARLWQGPAGESAADLVFELTREAGGVSINPARDYADVFTALAQLRAVRRPYNLHPRLAILGPLEARLLHFDLVILGGLNEGKWPAQIASDPWLSRPMREQLGLESPDRRIGLAAHDFASLSASPSVLLTRAQKENGSPTVPSRWLLRIKQLARGLAVDQTLTRDDLPGWARELDRADPAPRTRRPAPTPPVTVRPRSLSVTEIERWIRDPYSIYARHVLRLTPLDPLDQEAGPAERGMAIHRALERFLIAYPEKLPEDALQQLLDMGRNAFVEFGAGEPVLALWLPRFTRAAEWFLDFETARRKRIARSVVEVKGKLPIPSVLGFELRGRADRIDLLTDGSAAVLDYKSRRVPSNKQMELLLSPQLALEGAMLLAGAFGDLKPSGLAEFVHIRLNGGDPPGKEEIARVEPNALAHEARQFLFKLVARYESPTQGYHSWVLRERVGDTGDYDHLARVLEWSLADEAEE